MRVRVSNVTELGCSGLSGGSSRVQSCASNKHVSSLRVYVLVGAFMYFFPAQNHMVRHTLACCVYVCTWVVAKSKRYFYCDDSQSGG
jgi:hypothetical protein